MGKLFESRWFWPALLVAAVFAIYLPGLNAELVFDDQRLMDGSVFSRYGSLVPLQERLISYGSFVWIQALFGEGWWKQRLVNLVLHAGVALLLFYWVKALLSSLATANPDRGSVSTTVSSVTAASGFGALLFAVNPVSTYAVAYLIQRSILMATFFSVACLLMTLHAAQRRQILWLLPALLAYLLALLSKEYAVMLPVAAAAVYLLVRRPGKLQASVTVAGMLLVAVVGAAFLLQRYESTLLGRAFDDYSAAYLLQLSALAPGADVRAYPLSILNQAWLYLGYGVLWFVPNVFWMSIDLRPPFPVTFGSFPQVLGLPIYLSLLAGSLFLMIRYADWRRWAAFAIFAPAILFATEFATVWIQDPFVLYRSYLWAAVGFPILVAIAVLDRSPRTIGLLAGGLLILLGGLAIERVVSLKTEAGAWADAANKIDFKAQRNAVGRWRPLLNRGNQYLQKGMFGPALDDYNFAKSFGEPSGLADYHRAVVLQQMGRLQEALEASQAAERMIARNPNPHQVYLQKGTLLFQMGRHEEAISAIDQALARLSDPEEKQQALKTRAQSNIKLGKNAEAIVDYRKLVDVDPGSRSARIQLALAMHRNRQGAEASTILEKLLAEKDGADIRFARALVFMETGNKADAMIEARTAVQLKPGDPALQGLLRKIESGS